MAKVIIPFIDASNEKSNAALRVADAITDINITAIFDAVVGITLGNAQKSVLSTDADKDAGVTGKPANQFAQRETKWLCKYTDDVLGGAGTLEIPCADLALLGGTGLLDLTAGAGATFKTAFDANVLSPQGNAVTLNEVEHVGRNL